MSLVTTKREGRTATVSFDTGKRANALSQALMLELTHTAVEFHECPDISTVILTGRADNFSMGADLTDVSAGNPNKTGLSERRLVLRRGGRMCEAWEKIDAITICAIEGWCVGGGAALAAFCDLRVMGQSARFYIPEVERGMNMSWGSVPRVTALVGPARAKRLLALCEKIDAEMSEKWGLADHVVADTQTLTKATEIAKATAKLPPSALKMVKHDVNIAALALAQATSHRDLEAFALLQNSDDFKEGIKSFFEQRDPNFSGD